MKAAETATRFHRDGPVRTCAGCRRRDGKGALWRIALTRGGRAAVDRRQRAPGRGSYVHPAKRCVERATDRGGVARQLRVCISPEVAADLRRELFAELLREGDSRSEASAVGAAFLEKGQS